MFVKYFATAMLLIAGVINLFPVAGALSVEQLTRLYDVPLEHGDLIILMKHRAVLFGLLACFMIFAAFRSALQSLACIAGLASMLSFIVLACISGAYGAALDKVVVADIIGSVCLISLLVVRRLFRPGNG